MQPANYMTDQLGLIEIIPTSLWDRLTLSVPTGFSLEIFRSGRYLATLTPEDMSRRWDLDVVMTGDTILKVNLGYRHHTFRGELRSTDGLVRAYEIDLRLHISNAPLFALEYLQKSDPILLAQKEVTLQLELYAQGRNHNSMNEAEIRTIAQRDFSRSLEQYCGISVDQIIRAYLQPASSYTEIQTIRESTMVEEVRLNDQAHLEGLRLRNEVPLQRMREEQEIAFRVRDIRLAEMTDRYRNRQRISEAIGEGAAARIRDQFRRGYNLGEIRDENPEIEGLLQTSIQEGTTRQIPFEQRAQLPERTGQTLPSRTSPPSPTPGQFSVTPRNVRQSSADDETWIEPPSLHITGRRQANSTPQGQDIDAITVPGCAPEYTDEIIDVEATPVPPDVSLPTAATIRVVSFREGQRPQPQPVPPPSVTPAGEPLTIGQLGIRLVNITEEQRSELPAQVAREIAFVVQNVVEDSLAQQAHIHPGDLLMEIADYPVTDEATLFLALNHLATSRAIKIRVLRDSQIVDLEETRPI
ncbi:hypothetical protein KSF_038770 [Reticulibacter mediterranei]|uniref:PDZ domain-containing protein n=1 Tax=Reticulibacter mediterranei TaxID=2778369 RepID=A0A8J3ILP5_9CHLR|nr:PDZ domain-containing protein [Reticulibacter mediterranei]GHO93829.1 hypothetical protein KSF_038770 [Reticulibacter mediterranei]